MNAAATPLTRRNLFLLAAGVGIGVLPVGVQTDPKTGVFSFGLPAAYAEQGSGDGESEPTEPDDSGGSDGGGGESGGSGGSGDSGDGTTDGGGSDTGGGDTGGGDTGGGDTGGGDTGGGDTGGGDTGGGDTGGGDTGGAESGHQGSDTPVTPVSGNGRNALRNVTVRYPDGWVELILNDQYQLIDNLNRQVIARRATIEDFNRMVALGS